MEDFSRRMLNEIRKRMSDKKAIDLPNENIILENDNINHKFKMLMEEAETKFKKKVLTEDEDKAFIIKKSDVQFGTVRTNQEDSIRKTVGDVKLEEDALKYYPKMQDLILNGKVSGLDAVFQFRYKDPSGDGCYIWGKALQLTESNLNTIQKIRDAFLNWKQSLIEDGDLLEKLHKQATKD